MSLSSLYEIQIPTIKFMKNGGQFFVFCVYEGLMNCYGLAQLTV